MKQVLFSRDGVIVDDVPAPGAEPGAVLVSVAASCISPGTELSSMKGASLSLWDRARARPDQVRKVLETARAQGLRETRRLVGQKLAAAYPAGYSAAGRVIAAGRGVEDIQVGGLVACAGSAEAYHAEIIRAPRNLVVPIPDKLDLNAASTVTLGAIALQGVRRANPTLGETFVVAGLGLLGQLTVQILKANGCRVIGTDTRQGRLDTASSLGADATMKAADGAVVERVHRLTGGVGADGVIITAASRSEGVIAEALRLTRRKGRCVIVGDVNMDIDRADIYEKEIDVLISTSYGPGRYDSAYERDGLDYPVGYVRWTENRNMAAYLDLLASGKVDTDPLVGGAFEISEAREAYGSLNGDDPPLAVLLTYPGFETREASRRVAIKGAAAADSGPLRIALVGAGGFAKSTHLPLIEASRDAALRAVVTRNGHTAKQVAEQAGAVHACTSIEEVLRDADVDAVLIATRHDLHGPMALKALQAGKHVLVEKPLGLTDAELDAIEAFYRDAKDGAPVLLSGHNRRFSPHAAALKAALAGRDGPMQISYRVNAGYQAPGSWVHGPEGGGRNIGEACHFYDLFTYLTGAEVVSVRAAAVKPATEAFRRDDNFSAVLGFADGSVATLTYSAAGHMAHPKERYDVFCDGAVFTGEDFKTLTAAGRDLAMKTAGKPEKGHAEQFAAFIASVRAGEAAVPLWQQLQAGRIALDVQKKILGVSH